MDRTSRLLRNITSNWIGFALNTLVTLLLTPFVLRSLGIERYGIWILITSFIGYYGIIDFGFRAGVAQFLTRSLAAGNDEDASRVLSTACGTMALLGLIVLALTIAGAFFVPMQFDLPETLHDEAFWCILLVGSAAGVQVALSPFASVFVATQRFDLTNLIAVGMRLLSAVGIVVFLTRGYGLVGVAAATAATTIAGFVLRLIIGRRLVPTLELSLNNFKKSKVREIWSFGFWNFLISVGEYIYVHLLPLVVAAFMPIAAVGHYSLAAGLWQRVNGLFTPIGQVIYPAAAELHVRGENETLQRLYVSGTKLMLLIVIPVALIAAIWANDFYRLWIGPEYLTNDPFISVATIFRIMLLASVLSYAANVAGQILMGAGYIRALAILKGCGALITLVLSILFVDSFGLIAIALSAVVAITIVDIIGLAFVLRRDMNLRIMDFVRSAALRLFAVTGILTATLSAIHAVVVAASWPTLAMSGLLASIVVAPIVIGIGLDNQERSQFVIGPLKKIIGKK